MIAFGWCILKRPKPENKLGEPLWLRMVEYEDDDEDEDSSQDWTQHWQCRTVFTNRSRAMKELWTARSQSDEEKAVTHHLIRVHRSDVAR